MRRLLLGVAFGVAIGYAIAMRRQPLQADEDASDVFESVTRSPGTQRLSGAAGRFADLASERGARVVRQVRENLQQRLAAGSDGF
jgi:hypothetical protein